MPIRVWVVGDSTAQPIEQGFQALHKHDPRLHVRTFFKNSSGLIRTDVIDWFKTMRPLLEHGGPEVALLTFGPNDAQGIVVPGKRWPVAMGTDEWRQAYADRVRAFAELFAARGAEVYVLLQPFDDAKKHAPLMRDVNAALTRAATSPLHLVDVPALIARGPEVAPAKPTALKNADGIHLTFAGGTLIAAALSDRIAADYATRAGSTSARR